MENRLIHAFVYAISGFCLGFVLMTFWDVSSHTQINPFRIVLYCTLFFAVWGFVFPNSVKGIFMALWNLFK
ncbi:hypothetical protein SFB21_1805 [Acinetobacter bouvetii]|uniref:Uncharacterized protein n=1 Tax=Acinetobacter bouvetii TaxID=202951 RepID=A0A811GD02_9GAMM|nr:hypothetical protein SFB21_1805 [Acinetobacter bouvetii]